MISSREFMNAYEKFYNYMREYLWPYKVLEDLANLEVNIYTSFMDLEQVEMFYEKLRRPIEEVCEEYEDSYLEKSFDNIGNLIETSKGHSMFVRIPRVEEVNPDEDKQIKTIKDDKGSEE